MTNSSGKREIKLLVWTEFECEICGHREPTKDDKGESKEWLNHCGKTAKMILVRKLVGGEA